MYWVVVSVLFLSSKSSLAQAPVIAYSPAANALSVGVPFSIAPNNTGGAVPANVYGQVTTIAGSATGASGYVNATGTAASFHFPLNLVGDASGNIYIADATNNAIRKITPAGVVTTFAGSATGANGLMNGTGTGALFDSPEGMAIDASGNIYVGDFNNNVIRKITPAGLVSTFATGYNGPAGIAFDATGNLYEADQTGNVIRKVSSAGGASAVYAGSGTAGYTNNNNKLLATFNQPIDVQIDGSGNIFVADYSNNAIRKISTAGVVSTFAGSTTNGNTGAYANATGTAARFNTPTGIAQDAAGNFYIADYFNNDIREITPAGVVTIVAGSTSQAAGTTDGIATAALFNTPVDLYIDANDNAYITDGGTNNLREMPLTGYGISPALNLAGLSFDGTTGIISGTPTAAFTSTPFTITAYNLSGSSSITVSFSCTAPTAATITSWRGTTNSIWTTASNWSNGVPTAASNIEIGVVAYTGAKAQPTFSTSATVKSLVFGTNNTPILTINSGQTLTVSGSLGVNTTTTAIINGPGTISIGGGSYITSGGSLTASLNANITLAANVALTNAGTFTLASDANGSSAIGAIPLGASVNGTVTVQRFIQGGIGHRGYRLLSSPVTVDGTNYSINYLKTSPNGMYITATTITGGFDNTVPANPSLYLYRENKLNDNSSFTTGSFRGINNINASPSYSLDGESGTFNIPAGNGFLAFFRGNRSSAVFTTEAVPGYTNPVSATLSASGTLNTGTVVVSNWFTPSSSLLFSTVNIGTIRGLNLLGNPYPSTINFEKFNRNGANSSIYGSGFATPATIYVFNPVTKQYSSYKQKTTITSALDTTTSVNPTGSVSSDGFASNMIASGQGFFIQATTTGQTFTFRESAKTSTQATPAMLDELMGTPKEFAQQPEPQFRLRLVKDTINTDEVVLQFNNQDSTNYAALKDALDLGGDGALESLSVLSSDNVLLSIHGRPLPQQKQEAIPLLVDATATGTYQLKKIQLNNLPKLYEVWLMDAFQKDSLDLLANNTYSFNIDKTNAATYGSKRFSLVIRQNPAYQYRLLNFTASKVSGVNQVQVIWKTENEEGYTGFTIERSTDNGKTFEVIGSQQSSAQSTYSLLDKTPVIGLNYYRLKQVDINNTISYSNIIPVQVSKIGNIVFNGNINIYPNPAGSTISLDIKDAANSASYNILITNSSGLIIKQATAAQSSWQASIADLQPGTYILKVFNNKDNTFVGDTKFVKL